MTAKMMLHCGGRAVTLDELRLVKTPPATESYTPIDFAELVSLALSRLRVEFGSKVEIDTGIGLNKLGMQMFCVLAVRLGEKRGPALGLRSSHDQSFRAAFCGGRRVFVCDNLAFHADFLSYARVHTGKAWDDILQQIIVGVAKLSAQFGQLEREAEVLEMTKISQREGYEFLGHLVGERVLSSTQASLAFEAWRKPTHAEFEPRTAWSLANSANVGLKIGSPATLLRKHTQLNSELGYRFLGLAQPAEVVDVEPADDDDDDLIGGDTELEREQRVEHGPGIE